MPCATPAQRHWVAVKGRHKGILVYELIARNSEASQDELDRVAIYNSAFDAYSERMWETAIIGFKEVLTRTSNDKPSAILLARCHKHLATPPGADWDGIHHMDEK